MRRLRNLWRPAFLVALPVLFVWIPWTVRNYVTFGSVSPVTAGLGSVLWFGSRWAETGGDDQTQASRQALKQKTLEEKAGVSEAETDRHFMQEALRDILQKPGWFAHMAYRKFILFWKDANGVKKTLPAIHPLLAQLVNAWYYALLVLAVVGTVLGWRKYEWVRPLCAVIITYMMIYVLLHVRNRYRVPVLPLVFVLSAGGFCAACDLVKTRVWEQVKNPMEKLFLSVSPSHTEEGLREKP